jgi:hypothetical protein
MSPYPLMISALLRKPELRVLVAAPNCGVCRGAGQHAWRFGMQSGEEKRSGALGDKQAPLSGSNYQSNLLAIRARVFGGTGP